MFPAFFDTARLTMRPIVAGDAQAIFDEYGQDAEVTRYLTWHPVTDVEQTRAFVETCVMAQTSRSYMLVLKVSGQIVGSFDLRSAGKGKLDFGYVLARDHWGRGLMTEALTEVVGWALAQPSIWRIGAVADVENAASIRVMEKAGLKREGVLRRWLVHPNLGDAPRDCVSLAKTR